MTHFLDHHHHHHHYRHLHRRRHLLLLLLLLHLLENWAVCLSTALLFLSSTASTPLTYNFPLWFASATKCLPTPFLIGHCECKPGLSRMIN